MFLEDQVDYINRKLEELTRDERILIWGAGESALRLFQYTGLLQYNVAYIIDSKLYGRCLYGKTVMNPENVSWENVDVVIIAIFAGIDEIKNDLLKYGFNGKVITIHDGLSVPFYRLVSKYDIELKQDSEYSIFQKNSKYKNIHTGERVFILCTGPSINKLDLTKLKGEKTIAVSSFYLHKDCQLISPEYYCLPTLEEDCFSVREEFFKEVQQNMLDANYFFSIIDRPYIEQMKEYEGMNVNYISFSSIPNYENSDIDLTRLVLTPQSVPIMAMEIALYMGFKQIYLLGTEHDQLTTGKYEHFYSYNESIIAKVAEYEDEQGNDNEPFDRTLTSIYKLWNQYKIIKKIAEQKGTQIYNATPGGILDLFERVDYDKLF